MLLQMVLRHSFLWLSYIHVCVCVCVCVCVSVCLSVCLCVCVCGTSFLPIPLLMDSEVASMSWLL